MAQRVSSPPLITGNDGIVSRPPNEVNYSILNGKRMETGKQPGKEIRRKYKKYGLRKIEKYYVKEEENAGKKGNLIRPGDKNEIELMDKVEVDGEDSGATRKIQKEEEENLAQLTKKAAKVTGTGTGTGTGTNNSQNSKIKEGWDEDDFILEEEEKVGDEGKNSEAAAAGDKNEDMGATGSTGATEESSTSTTGEDGAVKENISLIVEEDEIAEEVEKMRRQRQKMKKIKVWVPQVPRRRTVTVRSAKTEPGTRTTALS